MTSFARLPRFVLISQLKMGEETRAVVWLLLTTVYIAPLNATDWDGPWKLGPSQVNEEPYRSEAECRSAAVQFIGRMHQGMLAPMRYKCVPVPASLPVGAPR